MSCSYIVLFNYYIYIRFAEVYNNVYLRVFELDQDDDDGHLCELPLYIKSLLYCFMAVPRSFVISSWKAQNGRVVQQIHVPNTI